MGRAGPGILADEPNLHNLQLRGYHDCGASATTTTTTTFLFDQPTKTPVIKVVKLTVCNIILFIYLLHTCINDVKLKYFHT